MTERTLILIKPDGVERGLIGEIISRIERKGLKLTAMDLRVADKATAEKHYAEHADKPFFGELVDFITSAPLVAGVVEGPRAIEAWRQLAGGTDPVSKATPGTIRGDFALEVSTNGFAGIRRARNRHLVPEPVKLGSLFISSAAPLYCRSLLRSAAGFRFCLGGSGGGWVGGGVAPAKCAYAQARKWGVFRLGNKQTLRACHIGLPLGTKTRHFRT